jgi:hypothetical protein
MILCLTPNPAIDRTLHVDALRLGEVHRADTVLAAAGGKGLNVARTIRSLGGSPKAGAVSRSCVALRHGDWRGECAPLWRRDGGLEEFDRFYGAISSQPQSDMPSGVHIWYMGINFVGGT